MIPRGRTAVRLLGVLPSSLSFHGSYAFPQEQGTRDSSISQHRYFNSYFLLFAFSLSQSFFRLFCPLSVFLPSFPSIFPFSFLRFRVFSKKKENFSFFFPSPYHRIHSLVNVHVPYHAMLRAFYSSYFYLLLMCVFRCLSHCWHNGTLNSQPTVYIR